MTVESVKAMANVNDALLDDEEDDEEDEPLSVSILSVISLAVVFITAGSVGVFASS